MNKSSDWRTYLSEGRICLHLMYGTDKNNELWKAWAIFDNDNPPYRVRSIWLAPDKIVMVYPQHFEMHPRYARKATWVAGYLRSANKRRISAMIGE